MKASDSLYF